MLYVQLGLGGFKFLASRFTVFGFTVNFFEEKKNN